MRISSEVRRLLARGVLAVLTTTVAACGSDDGKPASTQPPVETDHAVLVAERVFAPEGRTYYVSLVSDVPTEAVDRSRAREFQSADVEVFGGAVYIRDRESNTITRYTVSGDLELVLDNVMSFANTGLGPVRVRNAYLSETQAYALDATDWRLIGWNPTTMELTGEEISVQYLAKDGLPSGFIGTPVRVGERIVAPVGWDDYDNLVTSPTAGAMLVLGDEPGQEPKLVEDSRLGGAYGVYEGKDGAAYVTGVVGGDLRLFGSALGGAALPESGMLRIDDGESSFDAGYQVDVEAITGTAGVAGVYRVDDTTMLAQIWDPETSTASVKSSDDYVNATEFVFVMIDTENESWTRVDSVPKGGFGNAGDHVIDGKLFVNLVGEEASTVYPVTKDGIGEAAFTVPGGDLWHFERIR